MVSSGNNGLHTIGLSSWSKPGIITLIFLGPENPNTLEFYKKINDNFTLKYEYNYKKKA